MMKLRFPLKTLALLVAASGSTWLAVPTAQAQMSVYVDTDWLARSGTVVPARYTYYPTTYVSPSYVQPTSYYVPTSTVIPTTTVVPTTTVIPTATYYPTGYYYRRGLFGRPRYYVPTTTILAPAASGLAPTSYYVPTSYYLPTTYVATSSLLPASYYLPTSYVATSSVVPTSICCEPTAVVAMAPASPRLDRVVQDPPPDTRGGASFDSSVEGMADGQRTPVPRPTGSATSGTTGGTTQDKEAASKGSATSSQSGASTPKGQNPPAGNSGPSPPAVPDLGMPPLPPPPGVETGTSRRDSNKPVIDFSLQLAWPPSSSGTSRRESLKPVPTTRVRQDRNVLQGVIVSADTNRPEANVEVVFTDSLGRFRDRSTRTNGSGRFAISLPEGDWNINVTMPSGRTAAVPDGLVTASAGVVSDRWGRELNDLVISR
jgi:hypothetical protein